MFSKEFKEATYIQQQPTANNFKNKVAIKTFWLFKILRAIETKTRVSMTMRKMIWSVLREHYFLGQDERKEKKNRTKEQSQKLPFQNRIWEKGTNKNKSTLKKKSWWVLYIVLWQVTSRQGCHSNIIKKRQCSDQTLERDWIFFSLLHTIVN